MGLIGLTAAGCGSANFAGSYTMAVTNGENGCQFDNWTVGSVAQNIPMTITQSGDQLTAKIEGLPSVLLLAVLGSATFNGNAGGSSFDLSIAGSLPGRQNNCDFKANARAQGTLSADYLSGTISYTLKTDGSTDCGALSTCRSLQSFNGTRPPRAN